jgi:hypothetical protein
LMQASRGVMNSSASLVTLPRGRKYPDRNRTPLDRLLILRKDRVAKRRGCLIQGFRSPSPGPAGRIRPPPAPSRCSARNVWTLHSRNERPSRA